MNQSSIASALIGQLAITEPDLDTSVGTTVRNMVDAFAEQIAEAYNDNNISQFQYSLTTLSGSALDAFTALFGFTRFAAKPATGIVSFIQSPNLSRAGATPSIYIPAGTTVSTPTGVVFTTVVGATLGATQSSVDISIQAVGGGANTNVVAGSISNLNMTITGVSSVVNVNATSGGTDQESDSAYRARFQSQIFRGFLGTNSSFTGTCMENPNVSRAVTIGSSVTRNEQLQVTSSSGTLVATSLCQDLQYMFPYGYFVQDSNNNFLTPETDFTLSVQGNFVPDPTVGLSLAALAMSSPPAGLGTQGAATYYFKFYWLTPTGSTAPSPEVSITLSAAYYILVQWPTPPVGTTGIVILASTTSGSEVPVAAYGFDDPEFTYSSTSGPTFETATYAGSGTELTSTTVVPGQNFFYEGPNAYGAYITGQAIPSSNTSPGAVQLTVLNPTYTVGDIFQVQFDYVPTESRNSPEVNGVTNKVDIYTDGEVVSPAVQTLVFYNDQAPVAGVSYQFNIDPTNPYYFMNFQRTDGTYARPGNLLIPLAYVPLSSLPSTIVAPQGSSGANETYNLGTDYWQVNNISETGSSLHSVDGIEWLLSNKYGDTTSFSSGTIQIQYDFNSLPNVLESSVAAWGFSNLDVWVHSAYPVYLNLNLVCVLSTGATVSSVQATVFNLISAYLTSLPLGTTLELSSIISQIMTLPGIRAARFATNLDDSTNFAVQQVVGQNIVYTFQDLEYPGNPTDVVLPITSYAVLNGVQIIQRSQNTYRDYSINPA